VEYFTCRMWITCITPKLQKTNTTLFLLHCTPILAAGVAAISGNVNQSIFFILPLSTSLSHLTKILFSKSFHHLAFSPPFSWIPATVTPLMACNWMHGSSTISLIYILCQLFHWMSLNATQLHSATTLLRFCMALACQNWTDANAFKMPWRLNEN
jgi:hypothetical protein